MKIIGIIAEYNPFHNGHLYQIEKVKEIYPESIIIVAMSGNFLQRGEPAIVDKWVRAKQALLNGVDVVVEIPIAGCVQPADRFAENGVRILNNMGCEELFFGAEHAEYDFMTYAQLVQNLDSTEFSKKNISYAEAFQETVAAKIGHNIDSPNDVLGLAYAKANLKFGKKLKLNPISRNVAGYHDKSLSPDSNIASATAIRKVLFSKDHNLVDKYLPSYQDLKDEKYISWDDFWPFLRYKLISSDIDELANIYGMAEGIQYRMKKKALELKVEATFDEWLKAVKSKRFTYTRLTRLSVATLVGMKVNDVSLYNKFPYVHLLGFTKNGQKALNIMKKNSEIPLLAKISQQDKDDFYHVDYRAGKIYQSQNYKEQDLKRAPLIF